MLDVPVVVGHRKVDGVSGTLSKYRDFGPRKGYITVLPPGIRASPSVDKGGVHCVQGRSEKFRVGQDMRDGRGRTINFYSHFDFLSSD